MGTFNSTPARQVEEEYVCHRGQLLAVGENNEIGVDAVAKSVFTCTWKNGRTHLASKERKEQNGIRQNTQNGNPIAATPTAVIKIRN